MSSIGHSFNQLGICRHCRQITGREDPICSQNSDHVENPFMFPISCDVCGKPMGYAWDAEYDRPQDIHRCIECYDKIAAKAQVSK